MEVAVQEYCVAAAREMAREAEQAKSADEVEQEIEAEPVGGG
jgi:hypothetical protein